MPTLVFPKYSFVQGESLDMGDCYPDPNLCLPVSTNENLKFQFSSYDFDLDIISEIVAGSVFITPVDLDFDCSYRVEEPAFAAYIPFVQGTLNSVSLGVNIMFDTPSLDFDVSGYPDAFNPAIDQCFKFAVVTLRVVDAKARYFILGCTGCFKRVETGCYNSVLTYSCDEDSFDFRYLDDQVNTVELPMYLRDPEMNNDSKVYTKSDGSIVKLYERKEEQYILETDRLPYTWLKALDVAVSHDNVEIICPNTQAFDSVNTATKFAKKDNFEIEYSKGPLSAFGKGTCKLLNAEPVHLYNNNCA